MAGAQTYSQVLGAEEQEAGLQQPTGIGQRPRPMSSEEGPRASVRNYRSNPQLPTNASNDKYPTLSISFTLQWGFCTNNLKKSKSQTNI